MSFFPAGFDPRDEVVGLLNLVQIDTPDGVFGFLPGVDGFFRDVNGQEYWGSTLIGDPDINVALGGSAPEGEIGMSFFQDPAMPDLVGQLRALGVDYVRGRAIKFLVQPLSDLAEMVAPVHDPVVWAVRTMTRVTTDLRGPLERSLTLGFESPFSGLNSAKGRFYTTEDHSALVGAPNGSLRFMPRDEFTETQMFR